MATFSENSNWIDVTKPFNTDYHIAEKTNILFTTNHPFLVGNYLTETSSGATGILYELVSLTEINVARDSSTLFPATGELSNGTETFSYNSSSVTHGIDNDVSQRLVDRTKWLYDNKTAKTISLTAGVGLTGGGDLSTNRTISLGTPSQITSSSTNTSNDTTHTHAIDQANTARKGIVQLNNTLTSSSVDQALTAAQGKILQDNKAAKTISLTAGVGLTGGGDLSTNRTISLGTPSTCNVDTTNIVSGTTHTHYLERATEFRHGIARFATAAEYLAGNYSVALDPHNFLQHSSRNGNGYQRLPGGLIIQWGYHTSGNLVYHPFPITFPTVCTSVVVTMDYNGNVDRNINVYSISTTGYYTATASTYGCRWMAIGF